jgi:hypothetical protein
VFGLVVVTSLTLLTRALYYSYVKVNKFVPLLKHHAMKKLRSMELQFHAFLSWEVGGGGT